MASDNNIGKSVIRSSRRKREGERAASSHPETPLLAGVGGVGASASVLWSGGQVVVVVVGTPVLQLCSVSRRGQQGPGQIVLVTMPPV